MGGLESHYYHAIIITMKKYGKNYKKALDQIQGKALFKIDEAIKIAQDTSATKFDSTVEIHFNLNIDSRKADQMIRGTVILPHGTGKTVKIAAIVNDDKVKAAKAAGAASAGLEDLITEFSKGKINYDVIVATPDVMKHLGKIAKILGQKGIMPNPKSGTITNDIEKTIKELMQGRIEFRNDKEGNVHTIFGKVSFKEDELKNNLKTILKEIRDAKPSGVKSGYIKSITITTTMGPGMRLDVNEALKEVSK